MLDALDDCDNIENLDTSLNGTEYLGREIFSLREQVRKLKRSANRWRTKYLKLTSAKTKFAAKTPERKIFRSDQMKLLNGEVKRVKQWSNKTIVDSLQIRFGCGGGYDKLIAKGYPFPSTRTLMRHVEGIRFNAGILDDICTLLQYKIATMSEEDRDCGIVLDEMSTEEARVYCQNKDQVIGTTTLPLSESLATKALVFMLVGISSRWKQVVAFDFTGNSIPGNALNGRVMAIITKAEEIGIRKPATLEIHGR